ncbi:MAG TPA: ABC transporter permease [bacterium]|nr:ABC transporter permease [bacterium]
MNYVRVKAIARKEFIQVVRDIRSLILAFIIPVVLLLLFSYALTLDVDHVRVAVWDQDGSQASRDFLLDFRQSRYFDITGYYDRYDRLERLIDEGTVLMAMVVPKDFSKKLGSGRTAPVQVIVDGSDSNTAQIAVSYVESLIQRYNAAFVTAALRKAGATNTRPLDMRLRVWFNQDLRSRNFVIPGLIAVIMMIISALLTSVTFSREWERGTMEQLIATPVTSGELILGKFVPYFLIGIIDLAVSVVLGEYVFHVPFRGSLALLFALSGVFLTGAMMMGILISVTTRNQLVASQFAIMVSFLPAFLLSGYMYSIAAMPKPIQVITYIVPARYFIRILRGIYLKGVGMHALAAEVIFLSIFACFVVVVANKRFTKKVA